MGAISESGYHPTQGGLRIVMMNPHDLELFAPPSGFLCISQQQAFPSEMDISIPSLSDAETVGLNQ